MKPPAKTLVPSPVTRFLAPLLCLLAACHGSSGGTTVDRLDPPEGTGQLVIDMQGTWRVEFVEDLTVSAVNDAALDPVQPFYPPVVGDQVDIAGGRLTNLNGTAIPPQLDPKDYVVYSYLNSADGRFANYDHNYGTRPDPNVADGGGARLQMAFGSMSANQMLGFVSFNIATAFPIPNQPTYGLYRVILARIE